MAPHRYDSPATRSDLLRAARSHFTAVGFGAARTEAIVADAGLTRGALYHHFENKQGLFLAVLREVHAQVATEVNEAGQQAAGGAMGALRAGFRRHLEVVIRDDVRRILLIDGPAVIGWEAWHALDLEYGFGVTRSVLERAMKHEEIQAVPLDELTHVLLGAVTQAALELGHGNRPGVSQRRFAAVIDTVLDGLGTRQ